MCPQDMVPRSELDAAEASARANADRLRARARRAEVLLSSAAEFASETADVARTGVRALLTRADALGRALAERDAAEAEARAAAARAAEEARYSNLSLQPARPGGAGTRFVKRVSAVC